MFTKLQLEKVVGQAYEILERIVIPEYVFNLAPRENPKFSCHGLSVLLT